MVCEYRLKVMRVGLSDYKLPDTGGFVQNRMCVKHIVTHAEYDKLCARYARGEL